MAEAQTRYDEIPYTSRPFPQTRPERLAAVARLFGLRAPAVETARVLELGCAAGGNLIGMAQDFPGARFVGIDASARQIADGWVPIHRLGLKNIQLKHRDILEVGDELGEFDYILSHGVYSWVPAAVQDRMLEICRTHLAADGIGYISYNTLPGWHIRGIVRDMMRFHGAQFRDPATQLAQAKALVEFVSKSSVGEDTPYQRVLRHELDLLGKSEDTYLQHEHLEENNHPVYFHEFARKLAVNGLQYLGESEFSTMVSTNFAPEVAETLNRIGSHDILRMEQYMDFVRGRSFRQSLICHAAIPLNRLLGPDVVKGLLLASRAAPTIAEPPLAVAEAVPFRTPGGKGIQCRHPLTKLALLKLAEVWPTPVPFAELFAASKEEAKRRGQAVGESNLEDFFAGEMLACMGADVVEWRVTPAGFTAEIADRPATTPLARLQAEEGSHVTNMRGEDLTLDEIHLQLLRRLDGTRDLARLTDEILAFLKEGGHSLRRDEDNSTVTDEAEMRRLLGPALEKALVNLARLALLVPGKP